MLQILSLTKPCNGGNGIPLYFYLRQAARRVVGSNPTGYCRFFCVKDKLDTLDERRDRLSAVNV